MSRTKSGRKKRNTFRRRDYRAEYQRRKANGIAAGKSISAARGHPKATDLPQPKPGLINHRLPLERALGRIRRGESQKAAALAEGVSIEKLRIYRLQNTTSVREGRRWVIFDSRPQPYNIATRGVFKVVTLPNDAGSDVGAYWSAVNAFLDTNDIRQLEPFVGKGVNDLNGRFYPFEVRPNVLRKLDSIGELDFLEIYADVAV
jgi:hypothetical protein